MTPATADPGSGGIISLSLGREHPQLEAVEECVARHDDQGLGGPDVEEAGYVIHCVTVGAATALRASRVEDCRDDVGDGLSKSVGC